MSQYARGRYSEDSALGDMLAFALRHQDIEEVQDLMETVRTKRLRNLKTAILINAERGDWLAAESVAIEMCGPAWEKDTLSAYHAAPRWPELHKSSTPC